MFAAWGRFVHRRRWLVLGASVLAFAGLAAAAASGGRLYQNDSIVTEASRAGDLVAAQTQGPPDRGSFELVFTGTSARATDPGFRTAMESALAPLRADSRVQSVSTPYDGGGPSMISRDGHRAVAIVTLDEDPEQSSVDYPSVRGLVHSDRLRVNATGGLAVENDFQRLTDAGLGRAERVALPVSLLILVIAFGGLLAGFLPLGVGVMAITAATATAYAVASRWPVDPSATELIGLLGLGLAIDYSLFVVTRFREELGRHSDPGEALAATTATASRSIAFSGLTVMAGLSGLFFFRGTWLGTVATPMISVVAFAVAFNLTFLTALLAVLGRRVNWLRLPMPRVVEPGAFWRRLSRWVMRRPLVFLAPALALVVLAALPLSRIDLATDHLAMLPVWAESRQGADAIARDFPGQGLGTHTVVVVYPSGQPLSGQRIDDLYDLSRRIARLRGVASVQGPLDLVPGLGRSGYERLYALPAGERPAGVQQALRTMVGPHIVVMTVTGNQADRSQGARQLASELRGQHVAGGEVLVTGQTASDMDRTAAIVQRAPAAAAFIGLVTYLILFALLGSVVLPLKAVLTNLLSISASFGAVVWIFQEGQLSGQLGFTPGATDPTLPVLMFCLLFGLSMDYEVFLLSRIQEEYRRTGDNRVAVAFGLQRCGRLVTFAALIMVAVFAAFGLSDVVVFKAAGIGASIAVLMDATVVRGLIVPSLMTLMGRVNWWAPRPLARLRARFAGAAPADALRAA